MVNLGFRGASVIALLLAGCAAASPTPPQPTPPPPIVAPPPPAVPSYEPTRVLSQTDARRLLANKGLTLQWIDWNTRGTAEVSQVDGVWHLRGAQAEANGPGRLFLDGAVTEIGAGYFTFEGTIRIVDAPDRGRVCEARKTWHFAVTQGRSYYRLREFEWCDGLTDYVDIHF